ncbi:Succinate--hydroxymethylglutarate CoA-transferase [Psilocybe cubensis]|uniref:Succinate--hydroxymethylglutarate CoA-transferase n=1 Tax=Psilocybe cubensis TaxID=181762 RepID=A0ACB8GYD5_PSICU|nr:Succinate--hydroxymethylglutarate CoA-transferase [Psilocybe cubensis]KAH9480538.1 Succinate--hydroxymethylglutarate CoA-transferase [Psilocybe cubensis]
MSRPLWYPRIATHSPFKRTSTRFVLKGKRFYESGSAPPPDAPAIPYGPGIPPPLKGVRVLDLTRVLAGPTATMLLADLGADVIKVEEVSRGDDTRSWNPPSAPLLASAPDASKHLPPESAYFLAVNRNKRSITVNLKTPEGLEIVRKLVEKSDVLVENFVAGKLASLGLGWEDCQKINERLIYASITGYGQTGPYRTAAGYDVIIEAEAGLMHITGEPDRPPSKVGVAATDIATGLYAHGAIMAALLSRQQTGKGVWIDCNLFESQVAGLANIASNYLIAGKEASRHGTAHPSIVPYQVFPCKDGFLMIGAGNNKQFKTLAEKILEDPSLATNPKFATNDARVANRAELLEIITGVLAKHTKDHWLQRFTGLGVPFGPINNIEQTFNHPQALARKVTVEVSVSGSELVATIQQKPKLELQHARAGKIKLVAPAVAYNGQKMAIRLPPPWLSEHTDEVDLFSRDNTAGDLTR